MWYLIVSISDLCPLSYWDILNNKEKESFTGIMQNENNAYFKLIMLMLYILYAVVSFSIGIFCGCAKFT